MCWASAHNLLRGDHRPASADPGSIPVRLDCALSDDDVLQLTLVVPGAASQPPSTDEVDQAIESLSHLLAIQVTHDPDVVANALVAPALAVAGSGTWRFEFNGNEWFVEGSLESVAGTQESQIALQRETARRALHLLQAGAFVLA